MTEAHMSASPKEKRVDSIEVLLTPREWCIKLADEMRRQGSKGAHPEDLATETSPVSLNLIPSSRLAEHAGERGAGNKPEDNATKNQVNPKIRVGYLVMKALILKVNEAVKEKTVSLRLKVALELCTLYKLILDDGLGQPANSPATLPTKQNTDDADPDGENEFILDEAAIYGDDLSPKLPGNGVPARRRAGADSTSLIKNWIADSTLLIETVFAHKAAAQAIQEKFFDGHSILFEDVEAELNETIKAMEDLSVIFDEYIMIRGKKLQDELAGELQDQLSMDIEDIRASVGPHLVDPLVNEWLEFAKTRAAAEVPIESEEPKAQVPETAGRESQTCEIPITVQGSRNTRTPQPFLEETFTAIVFQNGAVLRLLEVVTHGQIVIIQNMRLKQEVACRVVSYKPNNSVEGNAEVEFIQAAPDFWGITFAGEIPNSPSSRSEASGSTKLSDFAPPGRQKEPTAIAPPAAVLRVVPRVVVGVVPKQAPAPFVKEEKQVEQKVEAPASPAAEVAPAMPEQNAETQQKPAPLTPPIETASMPPAARPAPDDSEAFYKAMIALYATPAPAEATTPSSPTPPAIVKALAEKHEIPVTSERDNVEGSLAEQSLAERSLADTINGLYARREVRKEKRSPEPARKSAASANPGLVPSTIGLLEASEEKLSKTARALKTKDSVSSSGIRLISKSHASYAKGKEMFVVAGVVGVLLVGGVVGYLWHLQSAAAPSQAAAHSGSTAAPSGSAGVLPQGSKGGSNRQTGLRANNAPKAQDRQKRSTSKDSRWENALRNEAAQDSTNGVPHQPSTLPYQIAAPVKPSATGTDTRTNSSISAPEINSQSAPNSAGEQNALLGSIVPGNSVPAPPRAPEPVKSERIYEEPRVLSRNLPPVYPRMAVVRGDEGEVILTVQVNRAGVVTGTKVISGPWTLLQTAANWVSQWRFEPAKLNGKPTDGRVTVRVVFQKPR
jgi:TonB family protein